MAVNCLLLNAQRKWNDSALSEQRQLNDLALMSLANLEMFVILSVMRREKLLQCLTMTLYSAQQRVVL